MVGETGGCTRRSFLRRAGALLAAGPAAAALAAGCGGGEHGFTGQRDGTSVGPAAPSGAGDAALLNGVLDHELTAIAAYTAGAPLLSGELLAACRRFLAQEQAHAAALAQAIRKLGVTPHGPRRSYDFGTPQDEVDMLRTISGVERQALAAYVATIPRLVDAGLRVTAASIVATEAEQLVVLEQALHRDPIPTAFVTGS